MIFAVDGRASVDDLRRSLQSVIAAGGGPLTIDLPDADDIVISSGGDAATTIYEWRSSYRMLNGISYDRLSHETNVWYRRGGIWKIIRMHLTRLQMSPISLSRHEATFKFAECFAGRASSRRAGKRPQA